LNTTVAQTIIIDSCMSGFSLTVLFRVYMHVYTIHVSHAQSIVVASLYTYIGICDQALSFFLNIPAYIFMFSSTFA